MIIDAGTAVTIDFLEFPNLFLGGYICCGITEEKDYLHKRTEKLPFVDLDLKRRSGIPFDTKSAISEGILNVKCRGIETLIKDKSKWNENTLIHRQRNTQKLIKKAKGD